MRKSLQIISVLTFLAVLASAILVLSRMASERGEKLSGLAKEKAEYDKLLVENRKLRGMPTDESEIARLRDENSDLLALRNQLQQLRDALRVNDREESDVQRELRAENTQLQGRIKEVQQLPARATCIRNLLLIDAAKSQLVKQNGLLKGETVTMEDIAPFLPGGAPVCPDGGHYSVNRVGSPPMCSINGHSIP